MSMQSILDVCLSFAMNVLGNLWLIGHLLYMLKSLKKIRNFAAIFSYFIYIYIYNIRY